VFRSSARALRFMKASIALILALTASLFGQAPPQKHPFTFEDMMKLKRVGAPVPSPDGKWVLFDAEDVDLEANTKTSHLWIVPASGGESRRLNQTANHEERPRLSPDGKRLIWTSKATDPTQIWICDFEIESGRLEGTPRQLTTISTGADGGIWSPDGKNIVFVSAVYPDCKDDACNKERDEELNNTKVKAKIFTRLFYRHWNAFTELKRSHLFVQSVGRDSVEPADLQRNSMAPQSVALPADQPRDLTPGDRDVPPFHIGGQDMYAISPNGQELAYTSNIDKVEATSTNNEIFVVPINAPADASGETGVPPVKSTSMPPGTAAATTQPRKISTSPGADTTPLYSPDGKYLAWRSQARAGFEADKWRLFVQDRQSGKTRDLTEKFDRSVGSFTMPRILPEQHAQQYFTPVYFVAEQRGEAPIFSKLLDASPGEQPATFADVHADDVVVTEDALYFTRMSIGAPSEICRLNLGLSRPGLPPVEPVTHMNDALLSPIDMQPLESFTFKGANDEDVQGFMVKPPGFDPSKKYPLKFLIHGGPQGAWGNSWSYRWNPELFAANGYVVVMINFHGSTGYGQKFTDSISGDWGGKPYIDLIKALDYAEKTYPFIDKNREAALGASYGGWMANWLLGHTDRFKCIVSHDGMFNTESAYGTTEELWFPEWEFKGPPWKQRELYRKFSPHLFADKFRTPTLVVHGQNDYRLDISEGFQLFTTLQRLKVPSKMLYFPDEGHWVLKPQNSRLWYKTVNDWVYQWCGR
jgi:dipeptidyl aminopeptidase/acylaminoacyl peptidase